MTFLPKEIRPRDKERIPTESIDGDTPSLTANAADRMHAECRRCGASLTKPSSVRAGVGPVCRHLEVVDDLEPAGGVR